MSASDSRRRNNRDAYWRSTAMSSLIEDIQRTITQKIEPASGSFIAGMSEFVAEAYVLDYIGRNDTDPLVYETFKEEVQRTTKRTAATGPWEKQLVHYLRGDKKRPGIEYEGFGQSYFVLMFLRKYWRPVVDPDVPFVLKYIETFKGRDGYPDGFNAVKLEWDRLEDQEEKATEERAKRNQDKQDAKVAKALGFVKDVPASEADKISYLDDEIKTAVDGGASVIAVPDLDRYHASVEEQQRKDRMADALESAKKAVSIMNAEIIESSEIVDGPLPDGSYYFWASPHWRKIPDRTRDRMIHGLITITNTK